ncbi:MAG: tyrosine-type recombinase/integrase [Desulfobacteria bacterium]
MPWITELHTEKVKEDGTQYTITKYRVGSFKNGRRKFKTFTNEKDAKAFAKALGKILLNKEYNLPGADGKIVPTFEDAAGKWFETRETNCKPSTIENYRYLLDNHVLPAFGAMRLDEIARGDIEEFVSGKKKAGMAPRSIRLMLAAMRPVFKRANKDGILTGNPASEPAELIKTGGKREVEVFTGPEVRHILATTKEHLPRFFPFLFAAFRTGMRQGELVALEWASIDWRGKFIEVRRNCWKGTFGSTKSGKGRRVDMSDQLAAVLTEHKKHLAAAALKAGKSMPELVFPSTAGTPRGASCIRRDFDAVLKKAQIRRLRFHDTRHTYASLLIANRESLAYIKEQMGHSSIQITVDIYGHLVPGSNRQAVNCLDDTSGGEGTGNRMATGEIGEAAANA